MEWRTREYKKIFKDGERELLTLCQRWPGLEGEGPGVRRVNRFYEALAGRWRQRWEGRVLQRATAAVGPDTLPWEAELSFTVTLAEEDVFSVFLDAVETHGGRRAYRVRQGDAWRLPAGVPVTLAEALPGGRGRRGQVVKQVRRQIAQRVEAGESVYYEDWPALCARRFSPERFYLTGKGPVVFYPMESIAPAMEGFPTFLLECPPS